MIRPRKIEYEFAGFETEGESPSYVYWEHYSIALDVYIDELEKKIEEIKKEL